MDERMTLKQLQQIEFDILLEFDRICRASNLRYSLDSGTLLGAVRHKDFIPWDDDVDVIMPRPDYEILSGIISEQLPNRYKYVRGIYWPFSKIFDLKTQLSPHPRVYDVAHAWMDIFPVDGVPSDKRTFHSLKRKVKCMQKQQWYARCIPGTGKTRLRAIAKLPLLIIPKIHGSEYYAHEIDRILRDTDYMTSELVSPVIFSKNILIPRKSFDSLVKVPFHGHEFWCIPDWDKYLTDLYGDYMQVPPESERPRHFAEAYLI